MKLKKVDSSMVYAIGYDTKKKILEVVFNSGKIYHYFDIPRSEYQTLMKSRSIGSHMQEIIECYCGSPINRRS